MFNMFKKQVQSFDELTPAQDEFLGLAIQEYNESLEKYNSRWDTEDISDWQFIKEDNTFELRKWGDVKVKADAQILGSFDSKSKTWEWAWYHPEIDHDAKQATFAVQKYGKKENIVYFKTGIVPVIAPKQTTYFAAVGKKLTGADAVYSGYANTILFYFVLRNIEEFG